VEVNPRVAEVDVRLVNVTKKFGDAIAVDAITLDVSDGEFFTLLGPSGCGKTTTLRMIGGFEQPTSGLIELKGVDVTFLPAHERDVNTVFQSYALFPHLTIYENVAFGLRRSGIKGDEIKRRVARRWSSCSSSALRSEFLHNSQAVKHSASPSPARS